ncbi:MAG: S41 family peptidase, partial [Candidatus Marinimicrobia bacterium]|nr:S41 family peptidase [Candidatus Neomarinimicrobiota bacterium]
MGQKNTRQEKLRKAMTSFVTPLPGEDVGRKYTQLELIQDIDFLINTMEDVHPNLYFCISKEKAESLVEELKLSLHDGFDRICFYTKAARIVASFRDGHTSVYTPRDEYSRYIDTGGLLFPFEVDCSSGEICILQSFSKEIHSVNDTIITSINGISAETILNSMVSLFSYERREMSLSVLSTLFGLLLFLLYGPCSTFTVVLCSAEENEETSVSGVTYERIKDLKNEGPIAEKDPYTFDINREKSYAVLDFRAFDDLSRFKGFIRDMFEQIETNGVKKLIVDLRKNGGGNSSLTEEFASYITDKPFTQFSRMDLKISRQIRKYYSLMMKFFVPFPISLIPGKLLFGAPWKKGIGETVSSESKAKKHKPKHPFFTGRVIVLTSAYTFSSATGFSTAIQDNDLGIIVGAPTGGFPSTHGDSFPFSLPNTCLQCGVSHKFFVRPDGNEAPEPLYPDYLIDESEPNAKFDRVLEYAIHMKLN